MNCLEGSENTGRCQGLQWPREQTAALLFHSCVACIKSVVLHVCILKKFLYTDKMGDPELSDHRRTSWVDMNANVFSTDTNPLKQKSNYLDFKFKISLRLWVWSALSMDSFYVIYNLALKVHFCILKNHYWFYFFQKITFLGPLWLPSSIFSISMILLAV